MSILQCLGLAGFRSYSPSSLHRMHFDSPLTLICGKNGSGKSTIIEVLRYVTTSNYPQHTEQGKYFIINPSMTTKIPRLEAQLSFKTLDGTKFEARRQACSIMKSDLITLNQFPAILQVHSDGRYLKINKKVSEVLNLSSAFLQEIVFGSQNNFLWPFSPKINSIFHKIFDFSRYISMMEAFKQQSQQYTKQIQQQQKDMEYLKRIYDADIEKKAQALRKMEIIGNQSASFTELQEKINTIQGNIAANKNYAQQIDQIKASKCIIIGKTQREVEQMKKIQELVKLYKEELLKQYRVEITPLTNEEIAQRIENLQKKKKTIQKELDAPLTLSSTTQIQIEVNSEIQRMKKYIKQLGREDTAEDVFQYLRKKYQSLEVKKKKLKSLRQLYKNMNIPIQFSIRQSQREYSTSKKRLDCNWESLIQLKQQILSLFSALYYKVQSVQSEQIDLKLKSKMKQCKARMQIKRDELQRLKSQYGRSKSSRRMINTELKKGSKKNKKGSKLQQNHASNSQSKQFKQSQDSFISQLTEELRQEQQKYKELQNQQKRYQNHQQKQEQQKTTQQLITTLKRIGISADQTYIEKHPSPTMQQFTQLTNQYQKIQNQIEQNTKKIAIYKQNQLKNKQSQQQVEQITQKRDLLMEHISQLQEETQDYFMVKNDYEYLKDKMQSYVKEKPIKVYIDDQQKFKQQIAQADREINNLTLMKKVNEANEQIATHNRNKNQFIAQLQQFDRKYTQVTNRFKKQGEFEKQVAELKKQYEKKKVEMDMDAQITYMQSDSPIKKDYLLKKSKIAVKKAMVEDLNNFYKAIETSIQHLHNEKMKEINRYIQQLWEEVYHSQDITLIQIQNTRIESPHRHVYQYSIMMEKNGRELIDMRQFSSIGQKVLASIIIKLALVKTFAKNCPILTLDDPTDFLDKQHIAKLAQQLRKIMQISKMNKLQMIIVTKDAQFVKMMKGVSENYYQVRKNEEGLSQWEYKRIQGDEPKE